MQQQGLGDKEYANENACDDLQLCLADTYIQAISYQATIAMKARDIQDARSQDEILSQAGTGRNPDGLRTTVWR